MSVKEMKKSLIGGIEKTEDPGLLEEMMRVLNLNIQNSIIYKTSDTQAMEINIARKEVENGNYFTNEEVNNEIDKWLNA